MQFIETARELEIYTIKQCARFPKRFMFLITKDIVALAKAVYNNVKAANSVYPTNAAEVQLRKKLYHCRKLRVAMPYIAIGYCPRICTKYRRQQTDK